jgi:hypothetical protein
MSGPETTGLVWNEQLSGDIANQRASHLGDYPTQNMPLLDKGITVLKEGTKLAANVALALATGGASAAAGAGAAGAAGAAAPAAAGAAGAGGAVGGAAGTAASLGSKTMSFAKDFAKQSAASNPRVQQLKGLMHAARRARGGDEGGAADAPQPQPQPTARQSSTGRPAGDAYRSYTRPAQESYTPPASNGPYAQASPRRAGFSQGASGIEDAEVVGEHSFPSTPSTGVTFNPGFPSTPTASSSSSRAAFPSTPTAPAVSAPPMHRLEAFSMGSQGALGTASSDFTPKALGPGSSSSTSAGPTSRWPRTGMGMRGQNRIASSLAGWNADNT